MTLTKIYFFIRDYPCCTRRDMSRELSYCKGRIDVNLRTLKQAGLVTYQARGWKVTQ